MLKRRNKETIDYSLTSGPGSLTKALNITLQHSGISLLDKHIWIEDRNIQINSNNIFASSRVGVQYAGSDAQNPWRYKIKQNPWVSPAP